MEDLIKLMTELNSQKQSIVKRRKVWVDDTKDLVISQLEYYVRNIKSDWYVVVNDDKANYESISLVFGNSPSGIFDKAQNKALSYIGGALHFSQIYNGKIFIWIEYPYIEEVAYHDPSHLDLKIVNPDELDDNMVLQCVETFIKEIIKADNPERQLIGYRNTKQSNS